MSCLVLLTENSGEESEVLWARPYHNFSHLRFRPACDVVPLPSATWGKEKSRCYNKHEWYLLDGVKEPGQSRAAVQRRVEPTTLVQAFFGRKGTDIFYLNIWLSTTPVPEIQHWWCL